LFHLKCVAECHDERRQTDNRRRVHDIVELLRDHEPFSGLDASALEQLAERVEVEFFAVGTTIFRQGEHPPDEVRVICRGAIELVDHGRVLDLLGEGELLGHPSMVSGTPTGLEARARGFALLRTHGG